ncbi:MAG: flagellar biosynthesis anti-sigma factor FlgM [Bdellovibrionota bacterium]
MTTLKLQWLAERLRKTEQIKKAVAAGTYRVESKLVAQALLGINVDLTKDNI